MFDAVHKKIFQPGRRGGTDGFSLVELMITVGIVGILSSVAHTRFTNFICSARAAAVKGCAAAVAADYAATDRELDPEDASGISMNYMIGLSGAGGSESCRQRLADRCIRDVNGDKITTAQDALDIINVLNLTRAGDDPAEVIVPGFVYDQNGDGLISPLDALLIINVLNNPSSRRSY